MKSVMSHSFAKVPQLSIQRSSFDRSHGHKTTFDAGYLIPIYLDEVLPGDTFSLNLSAFARLATPLHPVMDNMYMDTFFFFVPNRLLWTNWEKFNGAQDNPGDSVSFVVPTMTGPDVAAGGIAQGSLSDYMGLPTKALSGGGATTGITFDSLWHRAYNLIWNKWFRDENLQNSVVVDVDDGPDTYTDYVLLRRGKRHDYFTSCLPFLQKGTAVTLPLGTTAPVRGISGALSDSWTHGATVTDSYLTHSNASSNVTKSAAAGASEALKWGKLADRTLTGLEADLSAASAATINSLRQSFQLQAFYERDARGGTRYTEILRSHFGVTSPDARLQRPEYLGGGSQPVTVHPVQGTNQVTATTPQGNLAAFGTVAFSGHGFSKSFVEHGVIIGMVSVRADLTYQQGINRMFSRQTRPDFFWPTFAGLGEQAVLNKEIYANLVDGTGAAQKDGVFGYIPRYDEYRFKPSLVTGLFRSNATGTLDLWHLSQNFSSQATLNATFIQDDPPIDRVIAVTTEPHFIFDSYIKLICARPLPVFGVPSSLGKF